MRMPRNVEPQITYREPSASRIVDRSLFIVWIRCCAEPADPVTGECAIGAQLCWSTGRYRKLCSILVDALLRLRRFQKQIDELVRELLVDRQRLLVGAPHRRFAAGIEHRAPGLPLRVA